MFEREDWMLFRSIDSLGQKAGVGRDRIASVVLKELVDNALDAGANAANTTARWEDPVFVITDDGPGIPGHDAAIAHLFSIRRGLLSSKLLRLPTRGALGNGLRVVMGAVAASGGGISVSTVGRTLTLHTQPDGTTLVTERAPWTGTGTEIRLRLGPVLKPGEHSLLLANNALALARMEGSDKYTGQSSPHWYSKAAFFELCQGWTGSIDGLLGQLRLGRKAKQAVGPLGPFEGHSLTRSLTAADAGRLLAHLWSLAPKVKPGELGYCGPSLTIDGQRTGYAKRAGFFPGGGDGVEVPYIVEVWAAKKPNADDDSTIMWFANRTPTAAIGRTGRGSRNRQYVTGCGCSNYVSAGRAPVSLFVSVTSPYIPITTDGKEPDFSGIFDRSIGPAITAACRANPTQKETPKSTHIVELIDDAIETASGGGAHRYSLRQLYYATRPLLEARSVEVPDYTYFGSIVTDIEAARGSDLPGIYRDARGVLYHPHTGEQLALGTLGVEAYRKRRYAFHKVLYIEKGGFLPVLLDAHWPEMHDCAILTSQGFASRAARDVIDLLGDDDDEPIQFFCVHDGDSYGSLIYAKLQEETRARGARRVEIHNLGLDPWEGCQMGLQAETFKRKDRRGAVARYINDYLPRRHPETGELWSDWLQHSRYELNAMSSPQFLKWLNDKMRPFERAGRKLVPPEADLGAQYEREARAQLRAQLLERAAKDAEIDRQVEDHYQSSAVQRCRERLAERVRETLEVHPDWSWGQAVAHHAGDAVSGII